MITRTCIICICKKTISPPFLKAAQYVDCFSNTASLVQAALSLPPSCCPVFSKIPKHLENLVLYVSAILRSHRCWILIAWRRTTNHFTNAHIHGSLRIVNLVSHCRHNQKRRCQCHGLHDAILTSMCDEQVNAFREDIYLW